MSARGRGRRPTKRTATCAGLDKDSPQNWSIPVLKQKLSVIGICPPKGMPSKFLYTLYQQNKDKHFSQNAAVDSSLDTDYVQQPEVAAPYHDDPVVTSTPIQHTSDDEVSFLRRTVEELTRAAHHDTTQTSSASGPNISPMPGTSSGRLTSSHVAPNVASNNYEPVISQASTTIGTVSEHNLSSFYLRQKSLSTEANHTSLPNVPNCATGHICQTYETLSNGTPADKLPRIEIISPTLRQAIIAGKNVNMALLLLPDADVGEMRALSLTMSMDPLTGFPVKMRKDARLQKMLNISEFYQAFAIYRNVMCEAFPHRRKELDDYLGIINELHLQFGGFVFYAYHKSFAAKAAAWLAHHGRKVDWGEKDSQTLQAVTAGLRLKACETCGQSDHSTKFCPSSSSDFQNARNFNSARASSSTTARNSGNSQNDSQGRKKIMHGGKEICNNFNSRSGCSFRACHFAHVCLLCKNTHSASACTKKFGQKPGPDIKPNNTELNKPKN